jgi:hypothetical protein
MQRVRHWARSGALVVALSLVAGLGLSACREEPGVAAYVGATKYTIDQVDDLAAEAKEAQTRASQAAGRDEVRIDYGALRQTILGFLVVRDVAQRAAKDQSLDLGAVDPDGVAQQYGLNPGSPLARLIAECNSALAAFGKSVTPANPTEAQQREVYDTLTVQGQAVTLPFEQAKSLLGQDAIGGVIALRAKVADLVKRADVTINPQYAPLVFQFAVNVQDANGYVSLPLDPKANPSASAA